MKIIISPSKTQSIRNLDFDSFNIKEPAFQKSAEKLITVIKNFSNNELGKIFKTSDKITREVFNMYNSPKKIRGQAIISFSGTAFKQISSNSYTDNDWEFAQKNIVIMSGLYGALKPLDLIQKYRLDMNDKIFDINSIHKNLYEFWEKNIEKYFDGEEFILNLASGEYSKMLSVNQRSKMTTVDFLVEKNNITKSVAVYAKQQRGQMVNWIIKNKIKKLVQINQYKSDGFIFNKKLSNRNRKVFVKNII
jgi:hypothetical protein